MVNRPNIHIVLLAAGKGTRMKSEVPKVLHPISGLTLLERVLRTASALDPATIKGGRTPCLEGKMDQLLPALAAARGKAKAEASRAA